MTRQQSNNIPNTILIVTLATWLAIGIITLNALPAHAALQPNIIVSNFKVVEGDASIGKPFTLQVTLENAEPAACAQAITTSVQAGSPFIMQSTSTVSTGDLCYGASKTVEFPMKIDPSARGGFYQITIANTYETSLLAQYSSSSTINLFVQGTPILDANIASSTPSDVYAGNTATITIAILNNGGFEAQDVQATLTAPNTPLDIKWAGSTATLGMVGAKQSKNAQYTIEVPKNAAAGAYPMQLEVHYNDENLASKTTIVPLNFIVRKKAQFLTSDAGSDTLFANQNDRTVKLHLTNTGSDTAYKLKVKILPQFPFSTDGSVRYIETLAPGETKDIEVIMNVDKDGTTGQYGIDALVDYEDIAGKKLHDTATVSLNLEHKSIVRAVFLDYWFLWVIVLLVIVIRAMKQSKQRAAANTKSKK